MKYYAAIDTNVLVSALLRRESLPGMVTAESLTGRIIPLLNTEILTEYRNVLSRPKFHFPPDAVDVLLNGIIKRGIFVDAEPIEAELPDPKDVVFLSGSHECTQNRKCLSCNWKHPALSGKILRGNATGNDGNSQFQ